MDAKQTTEALIALQGCPVLVVGDVMLDRFVDGKVTRMSPEAPVPVLDQTASTEMPGGGANVACNLAALGCDVQLVAITGDDSAANTLSALLGSNMAIDFSRISDPDRPTTRKTRYRADGQQVLRVDEELTAPVSQALQDQLFGEVCSQLESAQAIILSDYAKGCMPVPLMQNIIKAAKDAGKPVIADPKLADFSSYAGVDLLTPNLAELRTATAFSDDTLDSIAAAAGGLAAANDIGAILATLSARGMLLAHADGNWTHAPAEARAVFDVSGAGDTVVATSATFAGCGVASIPPFAGEDVASARTGLGRSGVFTEMTFAVSGSGESSRPRPNAANISFASSSESTSASGDGAFSGFAVVAPLSTAYFSSLARALRLWRTERRGCIVREGGQSRCAGCCAIGRPGGRARRSRMR